jgi:hypothetical protein
VLALVLACDLDDGEAARVLRTDPARVLGLRRSACRAVPRSGARRRRPVAATARLHRPA